MSGSPALKNLSLALGARDMGGTRKMDSVLVSHQTDSWFTPKPLLEMLEKEFGPFDPDPALKTKKIDWTTDGLAVDWGKRVFTNPPYSDLERWCAKAYREFEKGCLVILLIPSRTDTNAWHSYVMKAQEIRLIKGRIVFEGAKAGAPFPSCVVIFDPSRKGQSLKVTGMSYKNQKIGIEEEVDLWK